MLTRRTAITSIAAAVAGPRRLYSLKLIATAVGYTNATALTRVFTQRLGASPTDWLHTQRSL